MDTPTNERRKGLRKIAAFFLYAAWIVFLLSLAAYALIYCTILGWFIPDGPIISAILASVPAVLAGIGLTIMGISFLVR